MYVTTCMHVYITSIYTSIHQVLCSVCVCVRVCVCVNVPTSFQRYETVKTEDIPNLENSEFSPQVLSISNIHHT